MCDHGNIVIFSKNDGIFDVGDGVGGGSRVWHCDNSTDGFGHDGSVGGDGSGGGIGDGGGVDGGGWAGAGTVVDFFDLFLQGGNLSKRLVVAFG